MSKDASEVFHATNREFSTGWIEPSGKIHVVQLYDHFNFFLERPEQFPDIVARHSAMKDHIDDEAASFSDSYDDGEHVEWHHHEIWASGYEQDTMSEIREQLYHKGWARIGTFEQKGIAKLEIETVVSAKLNLEEHLKDFLRQTRREIFWHLIDDTSLSRGQRRAKW